MHQAIDRFFLLPTIGNVSYSVHKARVYYPHTGPNQHICGATAVMRTFLAKSSALQHHLCHACMHAPASGISGTHTHTHTQRHAHGHALARRGCLPHRPPHDASSAGATAGDAEGSVAVGPWKGLITSSALVSRTSPDLLFPPAASHPPGGTPRARRRSLSRHRELPPSMPSPWSSPSRAHGPDQASRGGPWK